MFGRLIQGLLDIFYPKKCLSCKERIGAGHLVCQKCLSNIRINVPPFCASCGRHLNKKHYYKNICSKCIKAGLSFDRAFSPFLYEGVIRELIHEFKYKDKYYLDTLLAKLMTGFIKKYSLPIEYMDCIIPIPLNKTRLREREFNQAERLADLIAMEFNKPVKKDVLIRHKLRRSQTELCDSERFANVSGSFKVSSPAGINKKNILLIDDVLTTGATLSEASRVLKESGAGIIYCLTLAN